MDSNPSRGCTPKPEPLQPSESVKGLIRESSDSLLCSTLQDPDAVIRILNVHILPLHHVLNIERQIRLQCFLIIVDGSFFFALALRDDRGLVAKFGCARRPDKGNRF